MMFSHTRIPGFHAILALGIAALLVTAGCSDDDEVQQPEEFAPPSNLTVVNGDEEIMLSWSASPDEALDEFARYNLYRSETSLVGVDVGLADYKVGEVLKGGGYEIADAVANGTRYYYHVRAQKENGDLSPATNEVQGAGREEGEGIIIEEFASDGDSGFDFSTGLSVSLETTNENRFDLCDIYLGTTAADNDPGSALALKSPSTLSDLNEGWSDILAQIKPIGTDWNITTTTLSDFDSQFQINEGTVYAVRTPARIPSPSYLGKIQITSITGEAGSRAITFRYAYQSNYELTLF